MAASGPCSKRSKASGQAPKRRAPEARCGLLREPRRATQPHGRQAQRLTDFDGIGASLALVFAPWPIGVRMKTGSAIAFWPVSYWVQVSARLKNWERCDGSVNHAKEVARMAPSPAQLRLDQRRCNTGSHIVNGKRRSRGLHARPQRRGAFHVRSVLGTSEIACHSTQQNHCPKPRAHRDCLAK